MEAFALELRNGQAVAARPYESGVPDALLVRSELPSDAEGRLRAALGHLAVSVHRPAAGLPGIVVQRPQDVPAILAAIRGALARPELPVLPQQPELLCGAAAVSAAALRAALKRLALLAGNGVTPILDHVLLATAGEQLVLVAVGDDVAALTALPATVHAPLCATLPPGQLAEWLEGLDGTLAVAVSEQDGGVLRCGRALVPAAGEVQVERQHGAVRSRLALYGLPPDEFPVLPRLEATARVVVPHDALKAALGRVYPFAADGPDRPTCANAAVELAAGGSHLTLAACDGSNLAAMAVPLLEPGEGSVLAPPQWCRHVGASLAGKGGTGYVGPVELLFGAGFVAARLGDLVLVGRAGVKPFAPWRHVVHGNAPWVLDLDRAATIRALKGCRQARSNVLELRCDAAGLALHNGLATVRLEAEVVAAGAAMTAKGCLPVLLTAFTKAGTARVQLHLTAPDKPQQIVAADGFTVVAMPATEPRRT